MPRFDFRCTQCEHHFEAIIQFGTKSFPHCPRCHSPSEKIISPPLGIHFKGEGFYKTDSVKRDKESPASAEATAGKKEGKESKKEEKKPPKKEETPL